MEYRSRKWLVITRILSALVFSNTAEAFGQELAVSAVQKQVRMQLAEVPLLIKIARCESDFRQFDESGKPLRNPWMRSRVMCPEFDRDVLHILCFL